MMGNITKNTAISISVVGAIVTAAMGYAKLESKVDTQATSIAKLEVSTEALHQIRLDIAEIKGDLKYLTGQEGHQRKERK